MKKINFIAKDALPTQAGFMAERFMAEVGEHDLTSPELKKIIKEYIAFKRKQKKGNRRIALVVAAIVILLAIFL